MTQPSSSSSHTLHRRQVLAATGAGLCVWNNRRIHTGAKRTERLDELLSAHANCLPEQAGAGANHYPMAAEALEALGYPEAIEDHWVRGCQDYTPAPPRLGELASEEERNTALGDYRRWGDWLDYFRSQLGEHPWQRVLAEWSVRLAPGLSGALFHGVIRTGHATRALRSKVTEGRRRELAAGLAYWAARYTELPAREPAPLGEQLSGLEYPWLEEREDVGFHQAMLRMEDRPLAGTLLIPDGQSARCELDRLVEQAAASFLEMLVQKRNRIWVLHAVTGPAAVDWLLPELGETQATRLVGYAGQATLALLSAYAAPHERREHMRKTSRPWPELTRAIVDSRSIHGIKLLDAVERFRDPQNPLWNSLLEEWLAWT